MVETIAKMRQICQPSRESPIYQMNWFDKHILRWASIYITKLCIKKGITANQVTFIDFEFVILAGLFFLRADSISWIWGIICFFLYLLIDCVDGEVARFNEYKQRRKKQAFGYGSLLGGVVDWFVWSYVFVCMSFGIYFATGNIMVFAFGFLAGIMRTIYQDMGLMAYPILHEKGLLTREIAANSGAKFGEPKMMRLGRFVFGVQGFLPVILAVILIDCFVPAFGVGLFLVDARFIYLALFGLGGLCGVLLKIRDVSKNGVRIQRI